MASNKNRRDSFSFFSRDWADRVQGLAAAVWTRKGSLWFGGPYDRTVDLLLWVVRSTGGRPVMTCFRPRVDPQVAVATIDPACLVGAWDLSLREGLGALAPKRDHLACDVADLIVKQWPRAATTRFPVPAAFVGYSNRIPVRMTPDFAARLGDDPTPADVAAAWERVPTLVKDPARGRVFMYPAKFVSGDGGPWDVHPETLDPVPGAEVASARGWVRRPGGWAPAVPPGRGVVTVAVDRLAGVEAENPAIMIYKELGLLPPKTSHEDVVAIDAAARRLADPDEFKPADHLAMASMMRSRLSKRIKFTPRDMLDALLNPHRPVVASTFPKLASFLDADLFAAAGRGWEFDFAASDRGEPAAAAAAIERVAVAS